jgi:DNA-binding XRE family transcriptional regulator
MIPKVSRWGRPLRFVFGHHRRIVVAPPRRRRRTTPPRSSHRPIQTTTVAAERAALAREHRDEPYLHDDGIEVLDAQIVTNKIRGLLELKHITQEELSRRVSTSYRHINRVVLAKSHPSLLLACRIAAVLEAPITDIFQIEVKTRKARAA